MRDAVQLSASIARANGIHGRLHSTARVGANDEVMAAALILHRSPLAVSDFDAIWTAALALRVGQDPYGVEYVPKDDPQVQRLLRSREDVFTQYDREAFERAFCRFVRVADRTALPASGRVIYSMTRAGA